jgi:hypothetical protein
LEEKYVKDANIQAIHIKNVMLNPTFLANLSDENVEEQDIK